MKVIRDGVQFGSLVAIEDGLQLGAEAAREMVDRDGGRALAQWIYDRDEAVRAEFSSVELLAAYLRARRHESRDVPTVSAPPPSSPAARVATTTTTAARAATTPARPSATTATDAPAPMRPTTVHHGPTIGRRMPIAEFLSRAGLPPFRFVEIGGVGAETTLRNWTRLFQAVQLDPIRENPAGITVDRDRAMAFLASVTSQELRHLLAV